MRFGCSVSNCALELWQTFNKKGFESIISTASADRIHPNFLWEEDVVLIDDLEIKKDDVLVYHSGGNSSYAFSLGALKCRKVLVYHNETPPVFFTDYARPLGTSNDIDENVYPASLPSILLSAIKSRLDIPRLASLYQTAWTDSQYNASCLKKAGYKSVEVLPIPYKRPWQTASATRSIMDECANTRNILYVGRIIPNKKQVDIIKAFSYYNRIEPNSKLFLVGHIEFSEKYKDEFLSYADSLGVGGLVFMPGKVSDEDLEAYWQSASLFLSMSEHEGFCIPLLEAMAHEVPVLAYASSAVTETLGNAGVLFYQKNFPRVAEVMNSIIESSERTQALKAAGLEHIKAYHPDRIADLAVQLMKKVLDSDI